MKPIFECNRTAIVLGVSMASRDVSVSFFFDKEQADWIKRAVRNAHDINVFWRFRYSNTIKHS